MPELDLAGCGKDGQLLDLVRLRRSGYIRPVPSTEIDMADSLLTEFETIHALVHAGELPDDVVKTMIWCLDRLPCLYSEFVRTYESRYGDEIRRLVKGLLAKVSDAALQQAILDHLLAMHERLAIPALNFTSQK